MWLRSTEDPRTDRKTRVRETEGPRETQTKRLGERAKHKKGTDGQYREESGTEGQREERGDGRSQGGASCRCPPFSPRKTAFPFAKGEVGRSSLTAKRKALYFSPRQQKDKSALKPPARNRQGGGSSRVGKRISAAEAQTSSSVNWLLDSLCNAPSPKATVSWEVRWMSRMPNPALETPPPWPSTPVLPGP